MRLKLKADESAGFRVISEDERRSAILRKIR